MEIISTGPFILVMITCGQVMSYKTRLRSLLWGAMLRIVYIGREWGSLRESLLSQRESFVSQIPLIPINNQ